MNDLDLLRQQIDQKDLELLRVLKERQELVKMVGEYKKARKIEAYQPSRWKEVLKNLETESKKLELDFVTVTQIWELIHSNSLDIENVEKP